MSMIESIASASTAISMNNAKEGVSLSLLKDAMEQSEANIMKIMEMAPAPSGTTIDYIV
ncbi:putative motility protein [[Clostridium] colinum]|uniref:putative motility protein n=1 Tax=[Clostridium] colinum TaxID=36835 RepID=UPI002023F4BD|nr:putative motility protein [[Clostridium] colinum]